MSKRLTIELLKKKIYAMPEKERKPYLIRCLDRQGLIIREVPVVPIPKVEHDICKVCQSSSIIRSNHELICQQCGATEMSVSSNQFKTYNQAINYTKGTFIEPGTTFVTVIKDGKEVKRDLSKVNGWISNDPEETKMNNNMQIIDKKLETLSSGYNPVVFDKVKLEILAMWYNILIIKPEIRGTEKKALLAWSIYYPMIYNELKINIQQLASMFEIQVGDVYYYNFVLKDIFKGTPFEKYISIPIGSTSDIEIPKEINNKVDIIKYDLKDRLSNPLKDKELYGIIYYTAKQLKNNEITLNFLAQKTPVSTVIISAEARKIENFYDKNPSLKYRIFQT